MECIGFKPVAGQGARLLILGSLPGSESLRLRQYYAYRHNAFWKIMGDLIGAGQDVLYKARLEALKTHNIALWDVCKVAYRPGSLDSNIQPESIVPNNFAAFLKRQPNIQHICFNGGHAARLYRQLILPHLPPAKADIPMQQLPSTSPAHAGMPYAVKLKHWRKALGEIVEVR